MSLGIYPVFNPPVAEADFDGLGEALAAEFETLDELAEAHGITRLTAFSDTREVPEDFEGDPDELAEMLGPWEDWFSCRDGLQAMEGLISLIKNNTDVSDELEDAQGVLEELRAIVSALGVADDAGADFRLEMS